MNNKYLRIIGCLLVISILIAIAFFIWDSKYSERSQNFWKIQRILDDGTFQWKEGHPDKAIKFYEEASQLGSMSAKRFLVTMYATGIGTNPNREKALYYLALLDDKPDLKINAVKSVNYRINHEEHNMTEDDIVFWRNKQAEILAQQ